MHMNLGSRMEKLLRLILIILDHMETSNVDEMKYAYAMHHHLNAI